MRISICSGTVPELYQISLCSGTIPELYTFSLCTEHRYCGQPRGNGSITVLEIKTLFLEDFGSKCLCLYSSSHTFISENNPLVLHYFANKQQTLDADWDYFTKLLMITCYVLMLYEPSASFLTSPLWYKHFFISRS